MTTVAQRAEGSSRFVALPVLNLSARRRRVFKATSRPLYTRETPPVAAAQDAGWASLPVWTGKERRKSLSPIGVRPRTVQPVATMSPWPRGNLKENWHILLNSDVRLLNLKAKHTLTSQFEKRL